MIDLSGIKNIIFDLGGVILNIDYYKTSQVFKEIGFTDFDEFYSQQEQSTLFNDLETGAISTSQFISKIQEQHADISEEQIIDAWNAMLLDLPFARIQLIKSLNKKYRIFLLSNTNSIHLNSFLTTIKSEFGSDILTPNFEKVYLSHEIGFRKPNMDCFQFLLEDKNLKASETLFLDDSIQHIEGAQKCGIRAKFVDVKNGMDILTLFPDITL